VNYTHLTVCRNTQCNRARPEQLALNNLAHEIPQLLDAWIEQKPKDGRPQSQELKVWWDENVDELTEQAPDVAQWIRSHPHEAQLKLYGEEHRDPTASRRKPTQLSVVVPTCNHLSREHPDKPVRLPLLDKPVHASLVAKLTLLKGQLTAILAEVSSLDTRRNRALTLQITLFGDSGPEDRTLQRHAPSRRSELLPKILWSPCMRPLEWPTSLLPTSGSKSRPWQ
jgi:hypothetical protein